MTDEIDPAREPEAAAEFDRQMRKEAESGTPCRIIASY